YLTSPWGQRELSAALKKDLKVVPLLYVECEVPWLIDRLHIADVRTAPSLEAEYPEICAQLGGTPRPDPAPTTNQRVRLPAVVRLLPVPSRVPHHSLGGRFVGRVAELWELDAKLQDNSVVVITGGGGLGKTQLAVEYVRRFAGTYPGGIFWVNVARGL